MVVPIKSAIPSLACALIYTLLAMGLTSCLGLNDSKSSKSSKPQATVRLVPVMEPTVNKALGRRAASGLAADLESFQVAVRDRFPGAEHLDQRFGMEQSHGNPQPV